MNAPKLRFKEFSDEWIEYKIKDFGNIITGNTPPTNQKDNYGNDFLWASPIDLGKFKYITDTKTKLSFKGFEKARHIQKNSVLVTCIGSTIGKMGIASTEMSTNQQINSIICNNNFNNNYIYYNINFNFPKFLKKISYQAVPIISKSEFEKLKLKSSQNIKEQEKIGTFLSLLDKKIELQSKKIEALKLYKMCIKKIVFKDKKAWESKNIFEVLDFEQPNKYLVYSEDYIDDKTMIPVLTANKGFILGYCNEDNYYNKGDSIIFDDFTMDMKYTSFPYKIKSSAIKILTPKNNNNLKFLYESLISLNLSSKEHKRHYISVVQNMVIQVPNIDVQNKIAKILSTYDKKIEIEKIKFEKLILLKKGLMQNMFI